jgi:Bacteriocin-protection, YdeI or OmpD-Associated
VRPSLRDQRSVHELRHRLLAAGALESFEGLPVGKQDHITPWIEKAARPQTREKRVAMAIEVAFRARERACDRSNSPKAARSGDYRRGEA